MIVNLSLLWDAYWPAVAVAFLLGIAIGVTGFRPLRDRADRRRRRIGFAAAALAAIVVTAAWHGFVAGDRLGASIEQSARAELNHYEMSQVRATIQRGPLRRTLLLSGPADDFQRVELVRMMSEVPGAADARWTNSSARSFTLPLLVEAELLALAGFGLALAFAYLLELRRRSRAEWRW